MKRTVVFMRHGQAEDADFNVSDFARNLTEKGKHQSAAAANKLKDFGFEPDLILCSAANRTLQTAETCADALGIDKALILAEKNMHNAHPMVYVEHLKNALKTVNNILLIGHNPSMAEFANHWNRGNLLISFPTASMAQVEFTDADMTGGVLKQTFLREK